MSKEWDCHACRESVVTVPDDYEEEFCCSGGWMQQCGCRGCPINQVFCDDCETKIFKEAVNHERRV